MKSTNSIRVQEGIKNMWKKKYLILIPVVYCLIIGRFSYAGERILGKMGSPFSSDLYIMIFYTLMVVILMVGLIGIVCMLGTPISSKKKEEIYVQESRWYRIGSIRDYGKCSL